MNPLRILESQTVSIIRKRFWSIIPHLSSRNGLLIGSLIRNFPVTVANPSRTEEAVEWGRRAGKAQSSTAEGC